MKSSERPKQRRSEFEMYLIVELGESNESWNILDFGGDKNNIKHMIKAYSAQGAKLALFELKDINLFMVEP